MRKSAESALRLEMLQDGETPPSLIDRAIVLARKQRGKALLAECAGLAPTDAFGGRDADHDIVRRDHNRFGEVQGSTMVRIKANHTGADMIGSSVFRVEGDRERTIVMARNRGGAETDPERLTISETYLVGEQLRAAFQTHYDEAPDEDALILAGHDVGFSHGGRERSVFHRQLVMAKPQSLELFTGPAELSASEGYYLESRSRVSAEASPNEGETSFGQIVSRSLELVANVNNEVLAALLFGASEPSGRIAELGSFPVRLDTPEGVLRLFGVRFRHWLRAKAELRLER